ncbi:GH116 family glycosyl-hydrolase (plasmid) [Novosphingobium sp. BL-8A]|uniref:GH116 family glycosyl-hydrolase n=1 Tax=Novosphingobium sp. BL-8A TaxID=3127639 RepID=UPI003756F7E5
MKMDRRVFVSHLMSVASSVPFVNLGLLGGCVSRVADGSMPDGAHRIEGGIPEAAYVRPLGDVAKGYCPQLGDQQCRTGKPTPGLRDAGAGLAVPGLGLPVGGIGAGSFMINQCGTFGPWNMGGMPTENFWEQRTLSQAAFHIREEGGGRPGAAVRTLAVPHESIAPERRLGTVLPAWNTLEAGQGSYAVLFPFAWLTYEGLATKATMKVWSPIVSNEDERSSMPVAFFELDLSNPTSEPIDLTVMLTFPNAPAFASGSIRNGHYSKYAFDTGSGVAGVTLGSDAVENTPDAARSEWTIAAQVGKGQAVSYCTSWNADGDGSDIYAALAKGKATGPLPNGTLDGSASAGALALSLTLEPGQSQVARFALSWDFPQVWHRGEGGAEAVWMRRYTGFLGGKSTQTNDYIAGSYRGGQGFEIARRELARYSQSLADVEQWWRPIAENSAVPSWLRMSALNELYHMVFNGSFWESGLVRTTMPMSAEQGTLPRLGSAIPGTHLYFHTDSGGGGAITNEVDMDSAGYLGFAKLFRSMELGRVRPLLQMVHQNPIGIGRVIQQAFKGNGPYISQTASFQNMPATMAPVRGVPPKSSKDLGELFDPHGGDPFRDCPHKLIYRTYALIRFYNDDDLLRYGYTTMLKALEYAQFFRPEGSHLPTDPPSNNPPNTMDQAVVNGHGIYNCGLYLLSLQVMSVLTGRAARLGIAEATHSRQRTLESELVAAREEFERIFWNPQTGRYRYCDGSGGIGDRTGRIWNRFKPVPPPDSIWLESFAGQLVAMELGLPDIIDLDRARIHLHNTLDQFIRFRDPQGRLMGGPIILQPDFAIYPSSLKTTEINEVIPGVAWSAAAAAVRIGKRLGDRDIVEKALQLAEGCAIRIYGDPQSGLAFNSPESWFVDDVEVTRFPGYTRTRSIWSLYDAMSEIQIRQPH